MAVPIPVPDSRPYRPPPVLVYEPRLGAVGAPACVDDVSTCRMKRQSQTADVEGSRLS